MVARTDFGKYGSACAKLRNLKALIQGGLVRRAGTRFVQEVKDSTALTRVIEFESGTEQAYILESGNNYFRVFRNQGGVFAFDVTAVITNGTFDSDIASWDDRSGAGSSIAHNATDSRMTLTSNGTTNAHAEQEVTNALAVDHNISFQIVATGHPGHIVKLRIGTTTTGSEIVSDVPFGVGFHTFTFAATAANFFIQFLHDFDGGIDLDNVSIPDNVPIELQTPYTTSQLFGLRTSQNADTMYIFEKDTPVHKLSRVNDSSWSLTRVPWNDGPYLDENITVTTFTPAATTGTGVNITASSVTGVNDGRGFISTDVGRQIRIQHATTADSGFAIIRTITSTTVVVVDIVRAFSATTAIKTWSLGSWSDTTGYPRTGSFFEQRLFAANTTIQPQTIWGSQSADIENQRPDSFVAAAIVVEDDDGINYTIAATEVNAVQWLSAGSQFVVGTSGGTWIAESSNITITPNDIQIRKRTTSGCADIAPERVDDAVLNIQLARRKLNEFAFFDDTTGYQTNDMNILSDHILLNGVTEMTFQDEPGSILHVLRKDGILAPMAYRRSENVVGWGQFILGGSFNTQIAVCESVASISGNATTNSEERDEVWVIVKRTINGGTKRYVEFFEGDFIGPAREDFSSDAEQEKAMIEAQKDVLYTDSGLTFDNPVTVTNITQADPVVITAPAHGFAGGDEVESASILGMTELNGVSFRIATTTTNTFEAVDLTTFKKITAVTQADPAVVTSVAHGFLDGDLVGIFDVEGMTELNGIIFKVNNKTADTFELQTPGGVDIDSTAFTAYVAGGKIFNTIDSTAFTAYASDGVVREKVTSFLELEHLEGETVTILADGAVHPDKVVSSGEVTLDFAAARIHIGLGYEHTYLSLKMTAGASAGTAVGKTKRINKLVFVLQDAAAFKAGPTESQLEDVTFRKVSDATNTAVPLFTGETKFGFDADFNRDARILMQGSLPLPWSLLAIAPELQTHDLK